MPEIEQQAQQAEAASTPTPAEAPATGEYLDKSPDVLDKFESPGAEQLRGQDTTRPETLAPEVEPEPKPKLAGKYDTQEELEKGYLNLQKKYGGFTGAPEAYSLDNVNKDTDNQFIPDDKYLNQFMEIAKEHEMSQEMFDKTLDLYRNFVIDMMPKPDKEMEKIGEDATTKLRGLKMWADTNLSPEGKNRFNKYVGDSVSEADLFLLLDEMRGAMSPTEGPTRFEAVKSAQQSIKEIQQDIANNLERYENEPLYRAEKRRLLQDAFAYKDKYKK